MTQRSEETADNGLAPRAKTRAIVVLPDRIFGGAASPMPAASPGDIAMIALWAPIAASSYEPHEKIIAAHVPIGVGVALLVRG